MHKRYVIATIKEWNIKKAREFITQHSDLEVLLITERVNLNREILRDFNPRYIFFPHWSWIIPAEIYKSFECVIFHMTDLPFGRGGSPLQNLIVRGYRETKVTAFKCRSEIDAGPVYMKCDLDINGRAQDIYIRLADLIFDRMIPHIIQNEPHPKPQAGKAVFFQRRTPNESNISDVSSIKEAYDFIRMLDAETYPRAFLETRNLRFEFSEAQIEGNSIIAKATITQRKSEHE